MTTSCLPIQWCRTLVLCAAVAFAACSSSSTTNDAQIAGGSGGTTSAGSGGASAHLDAAVASTGGSTDSGAGGSTTSGGGSTGASNTGVDAAQADRPATGDTQADAPIWDSQGGSTDSGAAADRQPTVDAVDAPVSGVDGASSDASAAEGGSTSVATMFISDSLNGAVYRFNVSPGSDPVLTGKLTSVSASGMAVLSTGELAVAQYTSTGDILRFKSPQTTATPNGSISGLGTSYIEWLAVVDNELWADNTAYLACSTEPESVVRISFDGQGTASAAGTVTAGLVGADRATLWDPTTRSFYVTQCSAANNPSGTFYIQHFQVAADHTATPLTAITGQGLDNPHGMVITPWGELLVANAGFASAPGKQMLRFKLDSQGNVTPNGTVDDDSLNLPIDLAFAPWGELFVVNNGTATISRFTFDTAHNAKLNGTFQLAAPTQVQSLGVGQILFIAGASTSVDAGA